MKAKGKVRGGAGRLAALFPSGAGTAARTPFVLLVVVLLGSGLITLLLLNSALNQGSFELSRLERKTGELKDEQQALQQDVDTFSAPGALERRARQLGMVPGGNPAFLLPDGTVRGRPSEATAEPSSLSAPAGPSLLPPPAAPSAPATPKAPGPSASPGTPRAAASPAPHTPAPAPSAAPHTPASPAGPARPAPGSPPAPTPTTAGR
ncbi:septum formation initiator family protein [Streptomyces sp. NPDC101393]|uniref:septum formation initiator family protein n=1 Tax=Streptomyces sp. NPDC101393 TaxID=3366141 RepID=UPI00382BCAF8